MPWKAWLEKLFELKWLKVLFAILVLGFLLATDRFDWSKLSQLKDNWPWFISAFVLMLPPFVIVSYRFQLILFSQGINLAFKLATRFTMIGSFFDLVMPSSNGGDIVKAGYILRYIGKDKVTNGLLAVIIDRLIGLMGLFILASLVLILGWSFVSSMPESKWLIFILLGSSFGSFLVFRLLGSRRFYNHWKVQSYFEKVKWGLRAKQIISGFNKLRENPRHMFSALSLSVCNHIFWCGALLCITQGVGEAVDPIIAFVVFPVAIFCNIFGFAGGFGVGTAAFDVLLSSFLGISNGALIGFIFQALSALSKMFGLPFYIFNAQEPGRLTGKISAGYQKEVE